MKLSYSKVLLMALVPLLGTSLTAAEQLQGVTGYDIGNGWMLTGDQRVGYVMYDYDNSPANPDPTKNQGHTNSKGIFFIPKLSITSPKYNGFQVQFTGAASTDFGINDPRYNSRTFGFGASGDPYAILQEAFLSYEQDGHKFHIGAEEIVTPMVDADDWYLLADTYQAAYYENTMFDNILFGAYWFYKMAGPWDSGADGANYHTMADASFVDQRDKDNAGDTGIITGVFEYNKDEHHLQVWDYYAPDLYNTFFAQYNYKSTFDGVSFDAGAQIIDYQEVGDLEDNDFTEIDYSIFSIKLDGKFENGIDFATGASFYTDGPGAGATLGAWGAYPFFANGMVFHFFDAGYMRNTNSYKAQVGYDFSVFGIKDIWVGTRFTYFDLDEKYSKTVDGRGQDDMKMIGVRLSYGGKTGFYTTTTYEHVDLDHEPRIFSLRVIGGYRF